MSKMNVLLKKEFKNYLKKLVTNSTLLTLKDYDKIEFEFKVSLIYKIIY